MKISLAQLDMVWEDKEASLKKAEKMIAFASGHADLILFPEMTLTGFSMNLGKIGEEVGRSWSVEQMKALAVKYGIAIGFGWAALPEQASCKKGTNRFTLIDKTGRVLGEYCKIHPFTYGGEAGTYAGGEQLVTVPFLGHTLGLFVCYDLRFPEIFQAISKEADIILLIANWPASRSEQWRVLLQARAVENQAYVAGINCAGERDGLVYSGGSVVFDVQGRLLGELNDQEGILFCEIGKEAWPARDKFRIREDRRIDLYQSFFQEYGGTRDEQIRVNDKNSSDSASGRGKEVS